MRSTFWISFIAVSLFAHSVAADTLPDFKHPDVTPPTCTKEPGPWSVMLYFGRQGTRSLRDVYKTDIRHASSIYSIELARQLSLSESLSRYFGVQVATNFVHHNDYTGPIEEGDVYAMFRWKHFPWNHHLVTTIGLGEGVSYATHAPGGECFFPDKPTRFLNYLALETTFSLPQYRQFEFVTRVHHRSGAFGLYGPHRSGSNAVGIGIRYLF